MKKKLSVLLLLIILAVLFAYRVKIKDAAIALLKPNLPAPKTAQEFVGSSVPVAAEVKQKLLSEINLNVPFASQAPFANWGMPYQEACEEAAAIMVHYFYTGKSLDPKTMDEEILKLVEWENKTFGYYQDTNAAEIARIMREYFGHKNVVVSYSFTVDDIKREVANGHPVIVPAAGKALGNPNFRTPGPIYHALVIKGYTKDKIITNDPGTRKGADFLYDPDILMSALHEWNPKNILEGRPAMIVVKS